MAPKIKPTRRERRLGITKKQLRHENSLARQVTDEVAAGLRTTSKKERPHASRTFIAKVAGECERCADPIEPGQRCRYTADGSLVHYAHRHVEPDLGAPCPTCWMVGPCDC